MSASENRKLQSFGAIARPSNYRDLARFWSDLELAARDQIFLRDDINRGIRRLLVGEFRHSTSDSVLLGNDGYWFATGGRSYSRIPCASAFPLDSNSSKNLQEAIIELGNNLAMQGIKLSLMVVPLQSTTAAEKLPEPLGQLCNGSILEELQYILQRLKEAGVATYYDPAWVGQQAPGVIFHPKSFHWNPGGAFLYTQNGIKNGHLFGADFQEIETADRAKQVKLDIDLARKLGVAPMVYSYEMPLFVQSIEFLGSVKDAVDNQKLPSSILDEFRNGASKLGQYMEGGSIENGRGLIVGDSFSRMAFHYLGRHFESAFGGTTNILTMRPGQLKRLVDRFEADFVILILEESKLTPVEGGTSWQHLAKFIKPSAL